ncbi:Histone-lysine N-methyltransferase SETDB [Fasciola gigantica]|uniref:Histone-lysine N-methyltransferase SETDB n=1 Tax=Fasciola gigantica TaxID=46835 RepID=A0A504Y7I0_FASGI|nr:Histone-lysine N-methyltransferase SETDB [Fasciola gigantica]
MVGKSTNLTISTLTKEAMFKATEVEFDIESNDKNRVIHVKKAYSVKSLPQVNSIVPSYQLAARWPHLSSTPFPSHEDMKIGLLLGCDAPELPAVLSRRRDCLAVNWDSGDEDDLDGEEDVDLGMDVDNEFDAAFDSGILYSPSRGKTRTILEQPVSTVVSSVDDSMIQRLESNPSVFGHANVLCKIESFSPHPYPDPETLSTPVDVWPLPPPPPQFDDPTQVPRMHVDTKTNRVIPVDIPGNALDDTSTSHFCMCGSSFPHSLDLSLSESEKCANKGKRSSLSDSLTPILRNCLQSTSACMCSELTTSDIASNTTSCACSVVPGISSSSLAATPVTPTVLPIETDETMVNPVVETHVPEAWASNSADKSPSFTMIVSPTPPLQPIPVPPVRLNVNRFGGGFSCGPPVPTIPEVEEEEEDEMDDGEKVVLSPEESNSESVSGDCSKVTKVLKVSLVKCKRNKDLKGLSESTGSVVHTTQPQATISPSLAPPHIQSHLTRRTKTEQNQLLVGENEESETEEDYPLLRPDYFVGHDRPDACSFVTCGLERQRALDRMANCDKFEFGVQRDFHVAVGEIDSPTNERQSHIPALTGSHPPAVLRWLESTQVAVTIPRKDFSGSSPSANHDAAGSSGDSNTNTTTLNAGGDLSMLSSQSTLTIHEQTVDVEEGENSSVTKNQPVQPKTVLVQLTNTIPGENLGIQIKPVFTDRAELVAQGFRVSDGCRVESGLEVHHVMPNGRVAREGFLAAGDRILSIDGVSLIGVPFEQLVFFNSYLITRSGRDMFQAALKKPKLKLQIQRKAARPDFDKTEKKKSALPSCRLFIISDTGDKAKEAETLSSGRTISKPVPPPPPRRSPNTVLTRIPTGIVPPLIEELLREENRTGDQTGQSAKDVAPVLPPKGADKSRSSSDFLMPPPPDCLSIQLKKGSNGLGFSLTSRELAPNSPFSCGTERVVCVKNILPDGAALLDGRLRSGDRLIQVDGLDVTKLGQANTVSLLREKPVNSVVNLTIWRSKGPESSDKRSSGLQDSKVLAHITSHPGLEKRSIRSLCHEDATNSGKQSFIPTSPAHLPINQLYKLYAIDPIQYNLLQLHIHLPHTPTLTISNTVAGLTANSGRTSLLSSNLTALSSVHPVTLGVSVSVRPLTNQPFAVNHHPKDASNNAVFVRTVIEGGPAYLDGRLEVGDRLLTIDGEALSGISPSDAVNKLKTVIARDMVENRPHVCLLIARSRNASAVIDETGAGPKRETTRGSTKPHASASNAKDSSGRIKSGDSTDLVPFCQITQGNGH